MTWWTRWSCAEPPWFAAAAKPDAEVLTMLTSLQDFGFVPFFARQVSPDELERDRVGRVVEVQRSIFIVSDGTDERSVSLISALRNAAPEYRPTVGDWVVLDESCSRVERVLDRKSEFRRLAAGEKSEIQLIAANVDILFVVTSCNEEFKESRLERYLALAHEAGAIPVIVLTKIDLSDDPDSYSERANGIRSGLHVERINALDKNTFAGILAWLEPASTVALAGSSGVGKSTILNTMAGKRVAATAGIRDDDKKGRHTTTHRALHRLPGGGLMIDVPGMRELGVSVGDAALAAVFDDIEAVATRCRFVDCGHGSEPGCAVRLAVENGDITERRLDSYLRLLRENARNNASLAERRSKDRAFAKLARQVKARKKQDRSTGD